MFFILGIGVGSRTTSSTLPGRTRRPTSSPTRAAGARASTTAKAGTPGRMAARSKASGRTGCSTGKARVMLVPPLPPPPPPPSAPPPLVSRCARTRTCQRWTRPRSFRCRCRCCCVGVSMGGADVSSCVTGQARGADRWCAIMVRNRFAARRVGTLMNWPRGIKSIKDAVCDCATPMCASGCIYMSYQGGWKHNTKHTMASTTLYYSATATVLHCRLVQQQTSGMSLNNWAGSLLDCVSLATRTPHPCGPYGYSTCGQASEIDLTATRSKPNGSAQALDAPLNNAPLNNARVG